ncbi:MAG: DUF805 domain-containing protein [Aeriscardovia sp.]|nr:DUF805 domain-containing protein [Aeriscardovia sp.]
MIEEDDVPPEVKERKRLYRLRLTQPLYGASPLDACARFFFKYGQFSGRASLSEYWYSSMWAAGYVAVCWCAYAIFVYDPSVLGLILLIAALAGMLTCLVPYLSLTARRYHDAGLSALWMLIGSLISLAGILVAGSVLADATRLMFELDAIAKAQASGAPYVRLGASAPALSPAEAKNIVSSALAWEVKVMRIAGLVLLLGQIVDVAFCLLPSRDAGAKFDLPRLAPEWTVTKGSYLSSIERKKAQVSGSSRQD